MLRRHTKQTGCLPKVGVTYGVALASGTASLHLAMKLAGYAIGTEDVSENPTEAWEQCKLIGNIQ